MSFTLLCTVKSRRNISRHGHIKVLLLLHNPLLLLKVPPLPGEVKGHIDILGVLAGWLAALCLELVPGLGDEGGHGPLHDPLGEPLVEDGPHLAPVPGLGPAPVAPSSAAGHDGQGQQGALSAASASAGSAGASAGVSPQQPRDGADAAPQQGA